MDRLRLEHVFNQFKFDAIISTSAQTRQWLSKISTTEGWLIIEPKGSTLFVDGRYYEYALNNAKNVQVELLKDDSLKKWLDKKHFSKIGIEADYLTVSERSRIQKMLGLGIAEIISIRGQELRIVKSTEEVSKLQKAIDISLMAFEKLQTYIKVDITEKELSDKLEYIMKRLGADKEAFDSIVAFGTNTAMPHHHPTDKKLKSGDIVTIDFGAKYKGYCADITRTFIFEEQSMNKSQSKLKDILKIVDEAAKKGREAVKPGMKASDIDKICRDYIASKGYSKFFIHSTGHGIGLDVHEFPRISSESDVILEEGMVITIEPGIYLEGIGGARIEDDVLVTRNGYRVLSRK